MADRKQGGRGRGNGPAGTNTRQGGPHGPQLIRTAGGRWSDEAEQLFLDTLGASCNVKIAARAAGFTPSALYHRRRGDPDFDARWRAALALGYERIEELLLRSAADKLEPRAPDPDTPIVPMTVREMILLLQLHRRTVTGHGAGQGGRGPHARPRSLQQVRESILGKLEAIETIRERA